MTALKQWINEKFGINYTEGGARTSLYEGGEFTMPKAKK